jgi:hypothetical protein
MERAFPKHIVQISIQTPNSISAQVKGQDVKIENLGTERFNYKCSCGVWHADVKRGNLPYCVHYLYVLAELIRRGLISKTKSRLNRLDNEGFNRLGSLIAEISIYEESLQEFREGKILPCESCMNSYEISPLDPVSICSIAETKAGLSIKGIGFCPNDSGRVRLHKDIGVDFENLACYACRKTDFKVSLKIDKTRRAYRFVATAECKAEQCFWRKDFKSEILSALEIFAGVKKLRITQDKLLVERYSREGPVTCE